MGHPPVPASAGLGGPLGHAFGRAHHEAKHLVEAGDQVRPEIAANPQPLENRRKMIRNRTRFVRPDDPPAGIQQRQIVVQRNRQQTLVRFNHTSWFPP